MPWSGNYFSFWCQNLLPQIGAPCDDGNPDTQNDVIQDDCRCGEGAPCTNPTLQINGSVCSGHTYAYRGQTYGIGVSEVRIPGPAACDTIVTLTVTQIPQPQVTQMAQVCSGEVYHFRGVNYPVGVYQVTFPGALCDTLFTIQVDTLPQPIQKEIREVCAGMLTEYRGQYFSVGTYSFSYPGPVCDTLVTLEVKNSPGQDIDISATVCEGEQFLFRNAYYPVGAHKVIRNGEPCDTTYHLNVKASDDITVEINDSICIGSKYYFKGNEYAVGYYNVPVLGSTCDTLFVLDIAEAPCTDDDLILVNTITPNNDGVNDVLRFNSRSVLLDSELIIYNRWGDKVYQKSNYTNDWDGENYPGGTYFYLLRYKNKTHRVTLTIMK